MRTARFTISDTFAVGDDAVEEEKEEEDDVKESADLEYPSIFTLARPRRSPRPLRRRCQMASASVNYRGATPR